MMTTMVFIVEMYEVFLFTLRLRFCFSVNFGLITAILLIPYAVATKFPVDLDSLLALTLHWLC